MYLNIQYIENARDNYCANGKWMSRINFLVDFLLCEDRCVRQRVPPRGGGRDARASRGGSSRDLSFLVVVAIYGGSMRMS